MQRPNRVDQQPALLGILLVHQLLGLRPYHQKLPVISTSRHAPNRKRHFRSRLVSPSTRLNDRYDMAAAAGTRKRQSAQLLYCTVIARGEGQGRVRCRRATFGSRNPRLPTLPCSYSMSSGSTSTIHCTSSGGLRSRGRFAHRLAQQRRRRHLALGSESGACRAAWRIGAGAGPSTRRRSMRCASDSRQLAGHVRRRTRPRRVSHRAAHHDANHVGERRIADSACAQRQLLLGERAGSRAARPPRSPGDRG